MEVTRKMESKSLLEDSLLRGVPIWRRTWGYKGRQKRARSSALQLVEQLERIHDNATPDAEPIAQEPIKQNPAARRHAALEELAARRRAALEELAARHAVAQQAAAQQAAVLEELAARQTAAQQAAAQTRSVVKVFKEAKAAGKSKAEISRLVREARARAQSEPPSAGHNLDTPGSSQNTTYGSRTPHIARSGTRR